MTLDQLQHAALAAWTRLGRCNTLDAAVRREMCAVLACEAYELEAALTAEVCGEILYPV